MRHFFIGDKGNLWLPLIFSFIWGFTEKAGKGLEEAGGASEKLDDALGLRNLSGRLLGDL